MNGKTFDVVIYRLATGEVVEIVGRDMSYSGHYTPDKRLSATLDRLNENYSAEIVAAGKYEVGDFKEKTK